MEPSASASCDLSCFNDYQFAVFVHLILTYILAAANTAKNATSFLFVLFSMTNMSALLIVSGGLRSGYRSTLLIYFNASIVLRLQPICGK